MRDRVILLIFLHSSLLLATTFAFFSMFYLSYAEVIINVPQQYLTIQEAIDAASPGDTINVSRRSGESQSVYYERLLIDKQLTLVGESRETVIIDGSEGGTVIRIQADSVEIRGFTIRNGGSKYTGIRANDYSYMTIANNTIEANKYGIALLYSNDNTIVQNLLLDNPAVGIRLSQSTGNNVSDNSVSESSYGIELYSANATFVVGNTVTNSSYGIYLEYSSDDTVDKNTLLRNLVDGIFPHACHDIVVSNNNVSGSAYGIQLYNSYTITVLGNNVTDGSYGVYLAYSGPSNIIENNTISRNDWGVALYGSSSNTFKGNMMSYNTYGVDPIIESNYNLLYHNNFWHNIEQVVWNPDCSNTWDNGAEGNYWSDYTGTDSNGDGIGDTVYSIDPMNKDRYPLMRPWGPYRDIAVITVILSDTKVYEGEIVNITVTAENQGTRVETFNVTVKYENTTLAIFGTIGTQEIADLAPEANSTLTFTWNTTCEQVCTIYTIKAEASEVSGELDTANNIYIDGTVKIKMWADLNGDGVIDIYDLSIIGQAYGSVEGEPAFNHDADLNHDGLIDIRDLVIVAINYGKTC